MREKGAPPGRLAVTDASGDHLPRQAAYRPAASVNQAGLPGQAVAVLADPDHIPVALAQSAWGQHDELRAVAEDLDDVLAQAAGRGAGVQLGLDHDVPVGQVQPPGEPEQRRHLGLPAARPEHADAAELVLHQAG